MTGFNKPTSGKISLNGKNITSFLPHQTTKCGLARTFQNIRLFKGLSALDNVMIGRHLYGKSGLLKSIFGFNKHDEKKIKDKAVELLDLVGLYDKIMQKAGNLSYGDQRRLEIARALATEPKFLLLDEPAAGMNPQEKQELSRFIVDLRNKFDLTVILIEHHVPLVMGLCDRIAVLNFGQLIAIGLPEIVRNKPEVIEAYLGDE